MKGNNNRPSQKISLKLASFLCIFIYVTIANFRKVDIKVEDQLNIRQLREIDETNVEIAEKAVPRRRLRILTLGGSVTWGAGIDDRTDAYPFRLEIDHHHLVTNLAIRATGSDYPAQCISSMLQLQEENEARSYNPNEPFDVITFEYSINGMQDFPLLVRRLRGRYPDALFIYIDMFSLMTPKGAFNSKASRDLIHAQGGMIYRFGNTGPATADFDFRVEVDRSNPTDEVINLFGEDRHHASSRGHEMITGKIMDIIDSHDYPLDAKFGSWLGGDVCTSWFENGETSLRIIEGGEMKEWDESKHKFGIEVNQEDGIIIEYNHDGKKEAAMSLQYMTKAALRTDPYSSHYPPVLVSMKQNKEGIFESKTEAKTYMTGLVRKNVVEVEKEPNADWVYLRGLQKKESMRVFHVTAVSNIGTVKPGLNFIYIFPVEKRPNPFRLAATIVCQACSELGWSNEKAW